MNFKPTMYLQSIYHADFVKIFELGYRVLMIDLDNTLVPHDVEMPTNESIELVAKLEQIGFKVIILSNNNEQRVSKFAKPLNLNYMYSTRKPLIFKYKRLIKEYNFKLNEILCIGDQIMTDVYGANRLGVAVMLVDPLVKKDIVFTKFNRIIEKRVYVKLENKNLLTKGEYFYE